MDISSLINQYSSVFSKKELLILDGFLHSYKDVIQNNVESGDYEQILTKFMDLAAKYKISPHPFEPYHTRIRDPFDLMQFGLDFVRPLVDFPHSTIAGLENFDLIEKQMSQGKNAILLANHQTEADPQAIHLLLENTHPKLAEDMIFVAGERVITDSLAVPFSLGCNLLCIYSKKYIDNPPEDKREKQLHNKKTMQLMSQLLSEGGKCIYVAPSGGRDRPDESGAVQVAPFDSQSVEMFYLMAKKAKNATAFYPLSLKTYKLLPPPETIQFELGEARKTHGGAIHLTLGEEIQMEKIPGTESYGKLDLRKARAEYIWNLVKQTYETMP